MVDSIDLDVMSRSTADTTVDNPFVLGVIVKGQFCDGILVIRNVITDSPIQIFCTDGVCSQREFYTFIH